MSCFVCSMQLLRLCFICLRITFVLCDTTMQHIVWIGDTLWWFLWGFLEEGAPKFEYDRPCRLVFDHR